MALRCCRHVDHVRPWLCLCYSVLATGIRVACEAANAHTPKTMYSAYPGYNASQAPTLNRYYYPSSSAPPDPEKLARRQRQEDEKRQQLFTRLMQKSAEEEVSTPSRSSSLSSSSSSSSGGGDSSAPPVRPPSVISADTVSAYSGTDPVEADWEWLESTESRYARRKRTSSASISMRRLFKTRRPAAAAAAMQ